MTESAAKHVTKKRSKTGGWGQFGDDCRQEREKTQKARKKMLQTELM